MIATNTQNVQRAFSYTQTNKGNINELFPLFCPVRKSDWLDGWEYEMIYSSAGCAEKNCVFTTPGDAGESVLWQVSQYSAETYTQEFICFEPGKMTIRINIGLFPIDRQNTRTEITVLFTSMNHKQAAYIQNNMKEAFEQQMAFQERAINHYLQTGIKLRR